VAGALPRGGMPAVMVNLKISDINNSEQLKERKAVELRDCNTFDHFFMNHAYLSEYWLQEYLRRFKVEHSSHWDQALEEQLDDEIRHTKMCHAALAHQGITPIHDLKFSIQERLYGRIGNLK
jgi:hypothetical protein